MATFGNTSVSWSGVQYNGLNTAPYQIFQYFGGFPGGTITQMYAYMGGWNATTTAAICVWETSAGNLVYSSPQFTASAVGTSVGGQTWQAVTGLAASLAAGNYYIGWWRPPSGSDVWSYGGSGTWGTSSGGTNSGPGQLTGFSNSNSGNIGVYLVYTSGNANVRRSGTWHNGNVYVRRSGAWAAGSIHVRRSGTWH